MTEAMPFLQKTILLSYDPRPFRRGPFRRHAFSFTTTFSLPSHSRHSCSRAG